MTSAPRSSMPLWLPLLDLACVSIAGGLWYAEPRWWPLAIALLPWLVRWRLTGCTTRRTGFEASLGLFLLTGGVAVAAAYNSEAAWARFWLMVGGVLLFFALANAEAPAGLRIWFLALSAAAIALVFVWAYPWSASETKIGLLTRLGQALQSHLPPLPDPHVNANVMGGIIAALLPFAGCAVLEAWRERGAAQGLGVAQRWLTVGVSSLALASTAFGLVMSASRSAWIAVTGAFALAGAWWIAGTLSRGNRVRQGRILLVGLAVGCLAAAGLVVFAPAALPALLDALPGPATIGSRADLWRNGLTLVRDYPFTGVGLDGFMMAYSSYVLLLHVGYITHTHNLFLDVAIEQGLPALAILLSLCTVFFGRLWRLQTDHISRQHRGQLAAAALSLTIILLHGLVDDTLYKSAGLLLLFVPWAFVGAPLPENAAAPREDRRMRMAVVLGFLVLVLVGYAWRAPLWSRALSNRGALRQSQAELSVYSWPEWPIQDEVRRHVDLSAAIADYEQALAQDQGNEAANRRLGMIELSLGEYQTALHHLEAAYAADPSCQTTRQLLGEAYLANGRREEGRALWAGLSNAQGQFEARIWWYGHIGEEERAAWMRQAADSLR